MSNQKKMLRRALLASTCLTAASGTAAFGGIITEGTAPAPTDFPGTFGTAYLLPVGTTAVYGTMLTNDTDWFQFQGIGVGTPFTLTESWNLTGENATFKVFDSSQTQLDSASFSKVTTTHSYSGVFPTGGLFVNAFSTISEATQNPYVVTLSTGTPEPGTAATAGLALAAAIGWRKRRKQ